MNSTSQRVGYFNQEIPQAKKADVKSVRWWREVDKKTLESLHEEVAEAIDESRNVLDFVLDMVKGLTRHVLSSDSELHWDEHHARSVMGELDELVPKMGMLFGIAMSLPNIAVRYQADFERFRRDVHFLSDASRNKGNWAYFRKAACRFESAYFEFRLLY